MINSLKSSKGDKIFDTFNILILTTILLIILYPLYYILIASISDPNTVRNGNMYLLPKDITFEGYKRIFVDVRIWTGYKNTIIYTVFGTAINLILTLPAAYALSRKNLDGRKAFMLFITFTMIFGGGLIPNYMLIKQLGFIDKIWAMIIPNAVIAWNLIVSRNFFELQLPEELREASILDGCSDFKYFTKIVLPLSQALISLMLLLYGVRHWNEFFSALIYLRNEKLFPLQLILRNILIQNEANELVSDLSSVADQQRASDLIKYAIILVASLPLLILYPFLQKYFVKGVMIGAVKG